MYQIATFIITCWFLCLVSSQSIQHNVTIKCGADITQSKYCAWIVTTGSNGLDSDPLEDSACFDQEDTRCMSIDNSKKPVNRPTDRELCDSCPTCKSRFSKCKDPAKGCSISCRCACYNMYSNDINEKTRTKKSPTVSGLLRDRATSYPCSQHCDTVDNCPQLAMDERFCSIGYVEWTDRVFMIGIIGGIVIVLIVLAPFAIIYLYKRNLRQKAASFSHGDGAAPLIGPPPVTMTPEQAAQHVKA